MGIPFSVNKVPEALTVRARRDLAASIVHALERKNGQEPHTRPALAPEFG
jgi:hypothetical protein